MASTWIEDGADSRLAALWPGAVDYGDDLVFPFAVAKVQCERYAPVLVPDEVTGLIDVPDHYVAGQVLQCRALVRAGLVGDGGGAGGIEDAVTLFPMDWTVKNLIRPRKGMPYFGGRVPS